MEYYVYITNSCNANCSYCSVLIDCEKSKIPIEINYSSKDLKNFIIKNQEYNCDNVIDIYFFGGEPTLNFGLIQNIIDEMDSVENQVVNYILHTNGILIPEAPSSLLKKLKLVLISIDYEKIFTSAQINPYFERILDAVRIIKTLDSNVPIIGRLTVSPLTNIFNECSMLGNFFDYVYWQLDNSKHINGLEAYKHNYKQEIRLLFEYWLNFFREGIFLNYVPFISALGKILDPPDVPTQFYCGYGTSMIYIQTHGKCYACCDSVDSNIHLIGDIYTGVKFNNLGQLDLKCTVCNYVKLCGGRCGRMHREFNANRINDYCELNQYMFKVIEDNIDEINKILLKYPHLVKRIHDPMLNYTEFTA